MFFLVSVSSSSSVYPSLSRPVLYIWRQNTLIRRRKNKKRTRPYSSGRWRVDLNLAKTWKKFTFSWRGEGIPHSEFAYPLDLTLAKNQVKWHMSSECHPFCAFIKLSAALSLSGAICFCLQPRCGYKSAKWKLKFSVVFSQFLFCSTNIEFRGEALHSERVSEWPTQYNQKRLAATQINWQREMKNFGKCMSPATGLRCAYLNCSAYGIMLRKAHFSTVRWPCAGFDTANAGSSPKLFCHCSVVCVCMCACDGTDFLFRSHFDCSATKLSSSTYSRLKPVTAHSVHCAPSTIWMRTRRTADGSWMQVDNFFFFFFFVVVPFHLDAASFVVVFVIVWHSARRPIVSWQQRSRWWWWWWLRSVSLGMEMRYKCSHAFRERIPDEPSWTRVQTMARRVMGEGKGETNERSKCVAGIVGTRWWPSWDKDVKRTEWRLMSQFICCVCCVCRVFKNFVHYRQKQNNKRERERERQTAGAENNKARQREHRSYEFI